MLDTIQAYIYLTQAMPKNFDILTERNNEIIIKQTRGN